VTPTLTSPSEGSQGGVRACRSSVFPSLQKRAFFAKASGGGAGTAVRCSTGVMCQAFQMASYLFEVPEVSHPETINCLSY
jgi:hypothetical protein